MYWNIMKWYLKKCLKHIKICYFQQQQVSFQKNLKRKLYKISEKKRTLNVNLRLLQYHPD